MPKDLIPYTPQSKREASEFGFDGEKVFYRNLEAIEIRGFVSHWIGQAVAFRGGSLIYVPGIAPKNL